MPQSLDLAPERFFMENTFQSLCFWLQWQIWNRATCHIDLQALVISPFSQIKCSWISLPHRIQELFWGWEKKHVLWKMSSWIFLSGFGSINIKGWQQFLFAEKKKDTTPISWAILESLFYLAKMKITLETSTLDSPEAFGTLWSQELNQERLPLCCACCLS